MANHTGKEGHVDFGANTIGELKSWSLSQSANTIDDSELSDDWATKQVGQKSWSGSVEALWDEADVAQIALEIGAEGSFLFAPEGVTTGDTTFAGTAIVTSIENSAAIDGMVEATFSFEGNGALLTVIAV